MQGESEAAAAATEGDEEAGARAREADDIAEVTEPIAWREALGLTRRLLSDVIRRSALRMGAIIALNVIGVATRGGSLAAMILYVEAQTRAEPITLAGFDLPSDASPTSLLFWGTATLGSAALSILASIYADRLIFNMSRSYMEETMRRVLRDHAGGGDFLNSQMPPTARPALVAGLLRGDNFRIVRLLLNLLSLPLPLLTAVAAGGVLMWTNATLSLALLPVFGVYGAVMRRLNLHVMQSEHRRREGSRMLGRDMRNVMRTLLWGRYPRGFEPDWLRDYPAHSPVDEAMAGFRGVVLARRRSGYLADGFQGVALFMILVTFGALIAGSATPWSLLLTYFVGLTYLTMSLSRASKFFTTTARLLPATRRYIEFMQQEPRPVERIDGPSPLPLELRSPADAPAGTLDSWRLETPGLVYCVTGQAVNRRSIASLFRTLAAGKDDVAAALSARSFVSILSPLALFRPFDTLLPSEIPPSRFGPEAFENFLDRVGITEEWNKRFAEAGEAVAAWDGPPEAPLLETALRLMPGIVSPAEIFVLEAGPLDALDPDARASLLRALSNRCLIILSPTLPDWPEVGGDAVLLLERGEIHTIADLDWCRSDAGQAEILRLREEMRAEMDDFGSQLIEDEFD